MTITAEIRENGSPRFFLSLLTIILLTKKLKGIKYIPGNHDAPAPQYKPQRRLTMKGQKAIIVLLAVMLFFGIASSALGAASFAEIRNMKAEQEAEEETKEDGVEIAGGYTIESTLPISDAYKSGDRSALTDKQKETLDLAKNVIESETTEDMSDYEKELAIYRYLTKTVDFDSGILTVIPTTTQDCDNPYGTLKYHNAVCVGYATTFRMFMQMFGLECMVVHDTALGHSWDLVKLGDNWYHTDCYMDSGTSDSYRNFNMTDETCRQSHDWDADFYPAADSTEYNYFVRNSEDVDDVYDLPARMSDKINEEAQSFAFRIAADTSKEDQKAAMYIANSVTEYLNSQDDGYYEANWVADTDGSFVLCISFSNFNEKDYELDDDTLEKANNSITEFFPDFTGDYEDYEDGEFYYEEGAKG